MGILGTSATEEQELRAAAELQASRASADFSVSSQYETASDYATASSEYATASEFDGELRSSFADTHQAEDVTSETNSTIKDVAIGAHLPQLDNATDNTAGDDANEADDNSIQEVADFDPANMTENELNRIATSMTEQGASLRLSLTKSRTHGEYIDPKDLDWDGPDDKENPFNWPKTKKWFITMVTACLCLCVSLGSSLYVEGIPGLEVEMGISQTLGISGLTFYLIGLAVGPVIAAPISELIGRRYIYLSCFPASMLFTMGVGLAKNIRTVLVLRFFAGLIASPPMSLSGGTISDIWGSSPVDMSIAMAFFCVASFLGPVIGPIIGGFAAESKGWKWTMWVSLMFSGAILPFLVIVPETYKPAILSARAKKRGIKLVKKEAGELVKMTIQDYITRPVEMLFVEPIVGLTSLYIAFVFAVLFGFFEAFPIIFRGEYRMSYGVAGLPFLAVGVGLILGVFIYILIDLFVTYPKKPDGTRLNFDENGNIIWGPPEDKLIVAMIGAVFLPISLFWLAWTSKKSIHWIAPTLAGVPFGFGLIWVFFGIVLYYSMSFPPAYVASALAANNLLRYLLASVFPLFMVQMYTRLHIDWATSLLAFIALAMVPIPFAFKKYGLKLRAHSKYGYVALFKKLAEQKAAAAAAAAAEPNNAQNNSTSVEDATAVQSQSGKVESASGSISEGTEHTQQEPTAQAEEKV